MEDNSHIHGRRLNALSHSVNGPLLSPIKEHLEIPRNPNQADLFLPHLNPIGRISVNGPIGMNHTFRYPNEVEKQMVKSVIDKRKYETARAIRKSMDSSFNFSVSD